MKLFSKIGRYPLNYIMLFVFLLVSQSITVKAQEDDSMDILKNWWEWTDGENMLIHSINKQAFKLLDIRDGEIDKLKTKEDWIARQKKVKETLMRIVGPFPEKTPLNAKITGTIQRDGYRIEKILYESVPGYYVTSCLFIPDNLKEKRPAILNVLGHWEEGFRAKETQQFIYNFVKKGFIVFAIDPVGQGERVQYYNPEKKKIDLMGATNQHSYIAHQCFLIGASSARYFTWDGIRAVDYLLTRSEVDPNRIGLTGISGGGTQTSYIGAMDDRIKAYAPTCYITGFRRLMESIGPQDGEQNMYHAVSEGITHADYLEVSAPKPILMATCTRDFFSIQGARETYREVMNAYKAFGKEENFSKVESDSVHGYTIKNEEAIYAFFQKAFNMPGSPKFEHLSYLPDEELYVTQTGLVLSSISNAKMLFDVNREEAVKKITALENSRKNIPVHLGNVKQKAKELSGYIAPQPEKEPVFRGAFPRDGYRLEMYGLKGENQCIVPLYVFVPDKPGKHPVIVYVHPQGKSVEAAPGKQIEELVKKGYIVAAPDVINTGETKFKFRNANPINFGTVLIGRSIVGIQAGDIVRVVNFLKSRSDVNVNKIGGMAIGELAPAMLHAAAFDPSLTSLALVNPPVSYKSIVMNRYYEFPFTCCVAGALTAYDLQDLIGSISPRKIVLAEINDQMKKPASKELIDEEMAFPLKVYQQKNVTENLKILPESKDLSAEIDWCFK
jgi:dienelactone hydrolase